MNPMNLTIDGHSPIPIRRQLMEQLRHVIEGGGVPRDQALPSIRELAGFLGVNPNTVARVIDDLKRGGYVEARRRPPAPPLTSARRSCRTR
jgi:GntR family transcriptional regulator